MKYSIRGGWAESTNKTPPARLGRPQRWARMSSGSRPTLARVFLFSLVGHSAGGDVKERRSQYSTMAAAIPMTASTARGCSTT